MTDYHSLVPKDFHANLRYRRECITAASRDKALARELWAACSRDPLFYIDTFVWTYNPKSERAEKVVPFILWPYQERALKEILEAVGRHDLFIEKSREMGVSWLCLAAFEWLWHFREMHSFLLVSRKEDLVDKAQDPKCLFWKVDFILRNQPSWLTPDYTRQKLHLYNKDNGSTINGESTTGDVARGDRRTAILLDEFASVETGYAVLAATADATNCRIFNSTPKGAGNAFYDLRDNDIRSLRLHWSEHPVKSVGLYKDSSGKLRSPWYDSECKRRVHPMEIAQELDIDYLGSDYQFFDSKMLDALRAEFGRPPYRRGELAYDGESGEPIGFSDSPKGRLYLWVNTDAWGEIVSDRRFVMGVDVATGTGASNSCITIGDCKSGEKVAEFVSPDILPHDLAKQAVALGRWFGGKDNRFGGAYAIWESNGPGRIFGNVLQEMGYSNIYYRTSGEASWSKKTARIPGWYATVDTRNSLLGEYRRALSDHRFINRSRTAIDECRMYVFVANGQILHTKSNRNIDPSGARDNHADRVVADALCWLGMKQMPVATTEKPKIPAACLAGRRAMVRRAAAVAASEAW